MNSIPETHPPGGPASAAPPAPAARKLEPRMIEVDRLPRSIAGMLSWITDQDANLVRAGVFHSPLTRDIFEAARFVDSILLNSKRAEDWVGKDRLTGAERDGFRDRIVKALADLVRATAMLAKRARLTEILQRNRLIVNRYAPDAPQASQAPAPAKAVPAQVDAA